MAEPIQQNVCKFPECPSGVMLEDLKASVHAGMNEIKTGQAQIIPLLTQVALVASDIQNIKEHFQKMDKDIDKLHERLRDLELRRSDVVRQAEFTDAFDKLSKKIDELDDKIETTNKSQDDRINAVEWVNEVKVVTNRVKIGVTIAIIVGVVFWLMSIFQAHPGVGK